MVFKMLILLGFFTVKGGFFIHSDIHRSVVNRVNYSVQITANRTAAFRAIRGSFAHEMHRNARAKHTIFDRLEWGSPPFVFIWLRRFLIAVLPIRNCVICAW